MRHGALIAVALGLSLIDFMSAQVDGSNTEVSAAQRLADYLKQSEIPPDNRLLAVDDLPLEKLPRIAGDASQAAEILGFSGERLHKGSLELSFRVQIRTKGSYSFRTHLLAPGRIRGIEAIVNRSLNPGAYQLTFRFFGRAVRKLMQGFYTLPGILGEKLPDDGGVMGALAYYNKPYTTRSYRIADFSNSVYDSKEKREKIKLLQEDARREKSLRSKTLDHR